MIAAELSIGFDEAAVESFQSSAVMSHGKGVSRDKEGMSRRAYQIDGRPVPRM